MKFPIELVLSITTGKMLFTGGTFGDIKEFFSFMVGELIHSFQIEQIKTICTEELYRQHPRLKEPHVAKVIQRMSSKIKDLRDQNSNDDLVKKVVDNAVADIVLNVGLGKELDIEPLPFGNYIKSDPIDTLLNIFGENNVIMVAT